MITMGRSIPTAEKYFLAYGSVYDGGDVELIMLLSAIGVYAPS